MIKANVSYRQYIIWACLFLTMCNGFGKDLVLNSDHAHVTVRISSKLINYKALMERADWVWGTDGNNPKNGIEEISLAYNGHHIVLPKLLYYDLFNPLENTFSLEESNKHNFVITFLGGDAASSYSIKMYFVNGYFTKREILHVVNPDKLIVETLAELLLNQKRLHPRDRKKLNN